MTKLTRRSVLSGAFPSVAITPAFPRGPHHHPDARVHARGQRRPGRAPGRGQSEQTPPSFVVKSRPGAGGTTSWPRRLPAPGAPDGQHADGATRAGIAVVGRHLQAAALQFGRGLQLHQHADGFPVHPRHLSGSSGAVDRGCHQDRTGGRRQTDLRHRRQRHRHASGVRAVRRHGQGEDRALLYRGSPQGITDLLAKRIDFQMDTPTVLLPFIKDGRLRAIAVTGSQRFFAVPDVPTIAEAGVPGYKVTSWLGVAGPAGLPAAFVTRVNAEIARDPGRAGRDRAAAGVRQRNDAHHAGRI